MAPTLDVGFKVLGAMHLDAMQALHARVGNKLDMDMTDRRRPICFCDEHRSSACELLGELVAEVPAPNDTGEFRIGRVDHLSLTTSTRNSRPAPRVAAADESAALAQQADVPFSVLFCAEADGLRFAVRWYGDDGAPWLDGELPPVGAATTCLTFDELRVANRLYAGLQGYFEHCAEARAWRIADQVGDLGRYARRRTAVLGRVILDYFATNQDSPFARLGLLAFQLLVLAVAGVCLWAIWISRATSDLHLSASLSAGAISVLATSISMLEIVQHLRNVHSPELQTYVVRILFIVPVFATACWISLRFANSAHHGWTDYVDAVRHIYEAFVIHTFFNFLQACFGADGPHSLSRVLASKPQQQHLFGLRHVLRAPKMGEPFMLFCRYGTLQFVSVKTFCSIAEAALHAHWGHHSRPFSLRQPFVYMTIAINLSQMLALYALLLFYHVLHDDLAPIRPLGKFLSVKLIVFFTFWQSIAISVAVHTGLIHSTEQWGVRNISNALNNYLLCIEMLVAACLHAHVFSHRDFVGPSQLVRENRRLRRFDSILLEVVSPRQVLFDTRDMLKHCLASACRPRRAGAAGTHDDDGDGGLERGTPGAARRKPLSLRDRSATMAMRDRAHSGACAPSPKTPRSIIRASTVVGHFETCDVTAAILLRSHRSRRVDEPAYADPLSGEAFQDARELSSSPSVSKPDSPTEAADEEAPAAAAARPLPSPAAARSPPSPASASAHTGSRTAPAEPPAGAASEYRPGQLV
ncbi:hypothetical protein KFE25_014024 [Diacronema lutheri]|uniref:Transmembrane protein 184C n=2 Tax=Diacronema lutheri TaxID=2081491 RepID=A0A8J6C9W3_DIALT|nr:hypothetical protein KFE25_014024 [Diacronema lutheri]